MSMKNIWNTPAGMKDWLPGEACARRELMNRLLEKMALWGYEEITTPVLEYYQVLQKGEGTAQEDHLYKLIDRNGSILALRPEMTTPIARIASSKLPGKPPWRLMYGAQVFRYEDIQAGRQREFGQAGVELIGQTGPEADSEILALAIDALKAVGLEQFTVSLGHMGVLRGLLESLSWEEEQLNSVRSFVLEKDFVGLNQLMEQSGLQGKSKEELIGLLTRQLTPADLAGCLKNQPSEIQKALVDLQAITELLEMQGQGSYIHVDLSTLRNQEYYTGMVFEIYTSGIGYPIGGGGRYDRLLEVFGRELPATGFALGIERVLMSAAKNRDPKKTILVAGKTPRTVVQDCRRLREKGNTVIAETRDITREEAQVMAQEKGFELQWRE